MTRTIIGIAVTAILLASSCSNNKKSEDNKESGSATVTTERTNIPFTEAKNYFVKNTYQDAELADPKITSQADFDKLFGMATTMDANQKPTPVDFSTHYVIAYIGASTDMATTLTPAALNKTGDIITFSYKETTGEKQSFTTRPLLLIAVENQYRGTVKLEKQ